MPKSVKPSENDPRLNVQPEISCCNEFYIPLSPTRWSKSIFHIRDPFSATLITSISPTSPVLRQLLQHLLFMLVDALVTVGVVDGDLSLKASDAKALVIRIIASRVTVSNAVIFLMSAAIGSELKVAHDCLGIILVSPVSLHTPDQAVPACGEGKPCDPGDDLEDLTAVSERSGELLRSRVDKQDFGDVLCIVAADASIAGS